jgi:hypothetical protein
LSASFSTPATVEGSIVCRAQEIDNLRRKREKAFVVACHGAKNLSAGSNTGKAQANEMLAQDDPAAEGKGPLLHARVGMLRALNHGAERGVNSDREETHWGKRKLQRDE